MENLDVGQLAMWQVWTNGKRMRTIQAVSGETVWFCFPSGDNAISITRVSFEKWIARTGAKLEGRDE